MGDNERIDAVRSHSQVVTGVMLIAVGALFFADRQGWLIGWHLRFDNLWPLLLIAIGVNYLIVVEDRTPMGGDGVPAGPARRVRRLGGGIWIVLVGVLMLLNENHILMLRQSWPLFIVVAGLVVLFDQRRPRRREGR